VKKIAIVPAYNEQTAIGGVIEELRAFDPGLDVVVIDDASHDDTAAHARAHGARVVTLPFNLGIGGAVQTGFRFAASNGYELAVRLEPALDPVVRIRDDRRTRGRELEGPCG